MTALVLHQPSPQKEVSCPLCGKLTGAGAGPQPCAADSLRPVCRACARQHAPGLAALAELAQTAERVGRIRRHQVFPPLAALLDLAHAAENYAAAGTCPPRRAA